MTKTASDVVTQALKALRVIGVGEAPNADEMADALAEYIAFHDVIQKDLQNSHGMRGANWSYDSVPDNIWTHVAKMLAEYLLDTFPTDAETYQKVQIASSNAKGHLHTVLAKPKRSNPRFPTFPRTSREWDYSR